MPDTVISGSFNFQRRIESAKEDLEILQEESFFDIDAGLLDIPDYVSSGMNEVKERTNTIYRALKYFFEDLESAVKNNPS